MKNTLLAFVLGMAGLAAAQQPAAPAQPAGTQPAASQPAASPAASPQAPQQKKEIKDPAEYNAYVGAVQQPIRTPRSAASKHFWCNIQTA